jgi:hypothetical protein
MSLTGGPLSSQDFGITIREGRHQFSWHKKQEQSRISPSDTVVMLNRSFSGYRVMRQRQAFADPS